MNKIQNNSDRPKMVQIPARNGLRTTESFAIAGGTAAANGGHP